MSVKTHGAELKAFYTDESYWKRTANGGDDLWYDDLVLMVNGKEVEDFSIQNDLKDEDKVTIVAGIVRSNDENLVPARSFESFFKAWRKEQNTAYLCVTVSRDKLEAVRAAILAAGGKIS